MKLFSKPISDFDFQWKFLPCKEIENNEKRIEELLLFTGLNADFFKNKKVLDVGCGSGRYSYALMQLGANVDSIDASVEAINKCKLINPQARVQNVFELKENPIYDFVLAWGMIHHTKEPKKAFKIISNQVKKGGILHVMLYNNDTQKRYAFGRKIWKYLPHKMKHFLCLYYVKRHGGTIHGWWDALNPTYNFSFTIDEVTDLFEKNDFINVKLITEYNINMNGMKIN